METDKSILNKTPEQIFDELTANIDFKTKSIYFKDMHSYIFSDNNFPWNVVRFLYVIFSIYYPSQHQLLDINAHYDIVCKGRELYSITPSDPEYKKIPKYLHGVANKRKNTFNHPYDRHYIVKPARGQSKQYMDQCMKTFDALLHFEKMQSLYKVSDNDNELLLFVSELYNEVLKLVSMTTVCSAPKHKKDVMLSGSMRLLNEYNMAASFGTVTKAVAARQKILADTKSKNEKTRNFLHDMNNKELGRLSRKHDLELAETNDFETFQTLLRQQEQERFELIEKQQLRNQGFEQCFAKSQMQAEKDKEREMLCAQLKIARVTRMR